MLHRGIEKAIDPSYLGHSGTGQVLLPAPGNEASIAIGAQPWAMK